MTGIIIAAVVGLLAYLVFIFFKPYKETINKNVRVGQKRFIMLVAIALFFVAAVYIFYSIKGSGEGFLLSGKAEANSSEASIETDGNLVIISVEKDIITIGDEVCENLEEAKSIIYSATVSGKRFLLMDNYAKATTYIEVLEIFDEIGIDAGRIEEIREP